MNRTRNLLVLRGKKQDVETALKELTFKGMTILPEEKVSPKSIKEVFKNNKSVLCTGPIPKEFRPCATYVEVVNGEPEGGLKINHIDVSSNDIIEQFQRIAEKLEFDIGDHKSNSSGLNGTPTIDDCGYCMYLKGKGKHMGRTVYYSKHFFVVPTLGEFIKGYLLIIPIRHVTSMAEFTEEELAEFKEVLADVTYMLQLTYGYKEFLVWENGTGRGGIGKAKNSVVHAHVHIAPSTLTANDIKNLSGFKFKEISYENFSSFGNNSYLLIKKDDASWIINDNPELYIPRQYVRQILAREYNIEGEQWNWREYPFEERMYESYEDIIKALHDNWDKLPERIKKNTEKFFVC